MKGSRSQQMRAAEQAVTRVLLSDLFVALCMAADDPLAEAERRSKLNLGALDGLAEERGCSEFFIHAALHEMETFWEGVKYEVRERVSRGLD